MKIEEMQGDGNCLFRSVAYQVYGNDDFHELVRDRCMDYILACSDYFKNFIDTDEDESIEKYCLRKRQDQIWGDDLEI